jgi:uncharacterized secreted protein with C-terminal beta-propeller domain
MEMKNNREGTEQGKKGEVAVSSTVFGTVGVVIGLALVVVLILTAIFSDGSGYEPSSRYNPNLRQPDLSVSPMNSNPADAEYTEIFQTFVDQGLEENKKYAAQEVEYADGAGDLPVTEAVPAPSSAPAEVGAPAPSRSSGPFGLFGAGDSGSASGNDSAMPGVEKDAAASADESMASAAGGTPEFSNTNIQVEGVQEADIIKTDGKYIYAISSKNLTILEANQGKPVVKAQIAQVAEDGQSYHQMYLTEGKLIAIRGGAHRQNIVDEPESKTTEAGITGGGITEAVVTEGGIIEGTVTEAGITAGAITEGGITDDTVTAGALSYVGSPVTASLDVAPSVETAMVEKTMALPAYYSMGQDSYVDIFDVSNPAKPKKVNSLSQSGSYSDSRMIGSYLYLISNYNQFDYLAMEKERPETYVPLFFEGDVQRLSKPDEISIPQEKENTSYTVVSGIDTAGKGAFLSHESVFGQNNEAYCAPENLYLTAPGEIDRTEKKATYETHSWSAATIVTRITLDKGKVAVKATAKVPGTVLNQFSMDEQDGVLRMVTTCYTSTELTRKRNADPDETVYDEYGNAVLESDYADVEYKDSQSSGLYTLDKNLKVLGKIDSLAPSEEIHSCRFMGDIAYFVTFRQTDPLFSVDVSDPKNPRVLGELKIPGFSEYLHPYADGRLFGFGKDADENTGSVTSMKMTMFDNSDPTDVKEKETLVLDDLQNSEASTNHKAILVDARRNLIAFPADSCYMVYTYDDKSGFERKAKVVLQGESSDYYDWSTGFRGFFIDQVFYVISPRSITSFDMSRDFKKMNSLTFDLGAEPVEQGGVAVPMAREASID